MSDDVCTCGNRFDGDNFCMASACQWEGIDRPARDTGDEIVQLLIAHDPTQDDCDSGGLVCSNPAHLAAALAPLIAQREVDAWERGYADRDHWDPDWRARGNATNPYA